MPEKTYATATGFVQFDVEEVDINNQKARRLTIKTPGTEGSLLRITLWPEFADTEVNRGDFVAVDGELTTRESNGKTYVNISAKSLAVLPASDKAERRVTNPVGKKRAF